MKIGCIIMASGLSSRFGANKLLTEFKGRSLISIVLDNTTDIVIDAEIIRLVLTRTKEVSDYCSKNGVWSILHELPNRNEAVKLGVEQIMDCDACVFIASDQPLLKKDSICQLMLDFMKHGKGIYRLSYEGQEGNPILFSKEYFNELMKLPEKKGGAYLATKYKEDVRYVNSSSKWELYDVDTPDDLELLSSIKNSEI